jgi:hypothetical protein
LGASYGNHKIRAAPAAKIPTKIPGISAISMITSWINGGFDHTKKNGATRSIVRNGETRIQCAHHLSYGNHKIRAAPSAKMPTKSPGIMAISMIISWVDGGFDYGFP